MTDRPILFSTPMVRALLAGTKTQTRRLFNLPKWAVPGTLEIDDDGPYACAEISGCLVRVPTRINAGDRLWVRENAAVRHTSWHHEDGESHTVSYRADENDSGVWLGLPAVGGGPRKGKAPSLFPRRSHNVDGSLRWQPSIHMPRWASRLTLTVTDVRVERLQDISSEDAIAEGVVDTGRRDGAPYSHFTIKDVPGITIEHEPETVYAQLWEMINGEGSWSANPWVVAYTFSVQHSNIDQLAEVAA